MPVAGTPTRARVPLVAFPESTPGEKVKGHAHGLLCPDRDVLNTCLHPWLRAAYQEVWGGESWEEEEGMT